MPSSGTTVMSTTTDAAITLIAAFGAGEYNIIITNTSTNAGFYSIDSGVTWHYLTAGQSSSVPGGIFLPKQYVYSQSIQVKRVPSGGDISCFASAHAAPSRI